MNSISRVNVIGTSGSGKSTFARKLARVLDCDYVEMDKVFWLPNWEEPSNEVFLPKLEKALAGSRWVCDGNYGRTVPVKWRNVEMVIWLDYSFKRTLYQAFFRAIRRAWTKEEMWEGTGNRESFRKMFFSKKSIVWWTITSHGKMRARHEQYFSDPVFKNIRFVRLKDHSEADRFIRSQQQSLSIEISNEPRS